MKNVLFFNGVDAYDKYGIIMAEGAISALICPAPSKAYVSVNSRLIDGRKYISGATYSRTDERTLSLQFFIKAKDRAAMYANLESFANEILKKGEFAINTKYTAGTYHLIYKSCTQMQDFNGTSGKFTLSVVEPNPTNRTNQ